MRNFAVMCFGLLLAMSAASPNCWAQIKFDNGGGDLKFLTAANWDPDGVPDNTLGNQYGINDNFVVAYDSPVSTSVRSLIVGGDVPQTPGVDTATHGRLNISAGMLTVTGSGGEAFEIGRACCTSPGVSVVELTNDAVLMTLTNDPKVGTRDRAELLIRDTASFVGGGGNSHMRLGNYGPSIDVNANFPMGLAGSGLLDVSDMGKYTGHVIFIGDGDSDGVLRVSDSGSVKLTGSLIPGVDTSRPNRSALVHMVGSSATLEAVYNLESANGLAEVHNQYVFDADLGGVSEIKLGDAVNISNNDLVVNLNGFDLAHLGPLVLFDAAPNRIFGTFASTTVFGSPEVPHRMIYDQLSGDILVAYVPEPSTMLLLGLGMSLVVCAKRQASR
jgi:hypothetical protein